MRRLTRYFFLFCIWPDGDREPLGHYDTREQAEQSKERFASYPHRAGCTFMIY